MGRLLRHAWQPVAAVSPLLTGTSIFFQARGHCRPASRNVSFPMSGQSGRTKRLGAISTVSLRLAGLTALTYPWLLEPLNPTFS